MTHVEAKSINIWLRYDPKWEILILSCCIVPRLVVFHLMYQYFRQFFGRKVLLRPKIAIMAENYSFGRYNGFGRITAFYSQFLRFRFFGKNSLSVAH